MDLQSVIEQGTAGSSEKQRLIVEALSESFEIAIVGGGEAMRSLAARADAIPELRSDLEHQLACNSGMMWLKSKEAEVYKVAEMAGDGMLKVFLPTIREVCTTASSGRFGGGGGGNHNAGSLMVIVNEVVRWKMKT